jgi:hypothetical protein
MFSPAHIALVFPILSHTNAVQAYRSGVDSFSTLPEGHPLKIALFSYWLVCLIVGTSINLVFTYHYVIRLPKWTNILDDVSVDDDDERSELFDPFEKFSVLGHMQDFHETIVDDYFLDETFTSPAVLQANETGALVRVRRGTEDYEKYGPFKRTRHVSALGFDPILSALEFETERARLLDWAARTAPRRRHRTLSNPAALLAHVNAGTTNEQQPLLGHTRSRTSML